MPEITIHELKLLRDQILCDTGTRSCRALRQVNRLISRARKDKERTRLPIVTADMSTGAQNMDEFPMTEEERLCLRQELIRVERNLAPTIDLTCEAPQTPPNQMMRRPTAPPPVLNSRLIRAARALEAESSDDESLNWPFGLVRSNCVPPNYVDLTRE